MAKLIFDIKTARLYRDTETFGKMDPYVVLECGTEKKKTKTHTDGGKNPSWNQTLSIKATSDYITMSVYDEDVGSDDLVGIGTIDVNNVIASGGFNDWIKINYKGKEAGEVYCEISVASSAAKGFTTSYAPATVSYAPAYAPTAPAYAPSAPAYAPTYAPTYAPAAPTYTTYPSAPAYPAAPGYYAAPAPAPVSYSTAPAGFYEVSPGVYSPLPSAPAPTYPAASYSTYPTAPSAYYPTYPGYK